MASGIVLFCASAPAEEFEQHHAHEHGKVTLNLAVDGRALVLELDAPAANVVGFEHAPRTSSERAAVTNAEAWIRAGKDVLAMSQGAECRYTSTDFTPPQWEAGNDPDQDPDEDHDHGGSGHEGERHELHADYEARFNYECARPEKLAWVEPRLLDKLLNIVEARVNVLGPTGQRSEAVKSARSRIVIG
jgi:hypothetical protein